MFAPIRRLAPTVALLLAFGGLAACSETESSKIPLDAAQAAGDDMLPPKAQAALDAGNTEYRAARYDAALAQYTIASRESPTSAAPYYGILMAAQKLGNQPLADSASLMIRRLSGEEGEVHGSQVPPHGAMPPSGSPSGSPH
jgi:hypothetical protein